MRVLKPDTLEDELVRQHLSAFTAMGKPDEEVASICADLYGKQRVRVRINGAGIEMKKERFLSFCREAVRALEKL